MSRPLSADQQQYLSTLPASVQRTMSRALEGSTSPRQAIKAMCLVCCNFQRSEITLCAMSRCPLHAYRPYQTQDAAETAPRCSAGLRQNRLPRAFLQANALR